MLITKKNVKKYTQQGLKLDKQGGNRKQSKSYIRGLSLVKNGVFKGFSSYTTLHAL